MGIRSAFAAALFLLLVPALAVAGELTVEQTVSMKAEGLDASLPFPAEFIQKIALIVVTVGLGGVALWTWQRKYWDYQLVRQREDWEERQTYARKDSQRQSMEELLVEINQEVETFIVTTHMAVSARRRFQNDLLRQAREETLSKQQLEAHRTAIEETTCRFNEADQAWAATSRLLAGKVSLYFGRQNKVLSQLWNDIISISEYTCEHLTEYAQTQCQSRKIWDTMSGIRTKKDELLSTLQDEIDTFVRKRLESACQ